jgi:hypothetical protein
MKTRKRINRDHLVLSIFTRLPGKFYTKTRKRINRDHLVLSIFLHIHQVSFTRKAVKDKPRSSRVILMITYLIQPDHGFR